MPSSNSVQGERDAQPNSLDPVKAAGAVDIKPPAVHPLQMLLNIAAPKSVVRAIRLDKNDEAALRALQRHDPFLLPEFLARAVLRRKVDYIAGRYCARAALRELDVSIVDPIVATGAHREPLWPAGTLGSIAHTSGYAMAIVGPRSTTAGLGIDVERWLAGPASAGVGRSVATPEEIAQLVATHGWSAGEVVTLVFSAKESLFKCLYPLVREYFHFKDAVVCADLQRPDGFIATLLRPVGSFAAQARFKGRFECLDDAIVTAMCHPF
jgi:enterobactin synthetase component D